MASLFPPPHMACLYPLLLIRHARILLLIWHACNLLLLMQLAGSVQLTYDLSGISMRIWLFAKDAKLNDYPDTKLNHYTISAASRYA